MPQVTHFDEADVTDLERDRQALRDSSPVRLTMLPCVVRATALAMRQWPRFNASLNEAGDALILKKYVHIGIAIDTPRGLAVGVVRDCDRKGVPQIATEIAYLSAKARARGLSWEEISGAGLTISSLGALGGSGFTPLVNAPEVAILGVSRLQARPAPAPDGGVAWRSALPLALSYDHRVINGADAARFVASVSAALASPEALLVP